jgi:hypothetical protein
MDAWLEACTPVPDCDVCQANYKQLQEAQQAEDHDKARIHAKEVREHPHDRG